MQERNNQKQSPRERPPRHYHEEVPGEGTILEYPQKPSAVEVSRKAALDELTDNILKEVSSNGQQSDGESKPDVASETVSVPSGEKTDVVRLFEVKKQLEELREQVKSKSQDTDSNEKIEAIESLIRKFEEENHNIVDTEKKISTLSNLKDKLETLQTEDAKDKSNESINAQGVRTHNIQRTQAEITHRENKLQENQSSAEKKRTGWWNNDFRASQNYGVSNVEEPALKTESSNTSELQGNHEYIEIRNQWKEKKTAYEDMYKGYIQDQKNKSLLGKAVSFFRKKEQPDWLLKAQAEYQDARRNYAASLDKALGSRLKTRLTDSVSGISVDSRANSLSAALANRFVLKAAESQMNIEKEALNGNQSRIFGKVGEIFKTHGKKIGYGTVLGIGLLTGGLTGIAYAGGRLALRAGLASTGSMGSMLLATTGLSALGGIGGAVLGKKGTDFLIDWKQNNLDSSVTSSRKSFDVESLDALEVAHYKKLKSLDSAIRNQKKIVTASALAGAIAGGALGGNFETDSLPEDAHNVVGVDKLDADSALQPQVAQEPAVDSASGAGNPAELRPYVPGARTVGVEAGSWPGELVSPPVQEPFGSASVATTIEESTVTIPVAPEAEAPDPLESDVIPAAKITLVPDEVEAPAPVPEGKPTFGENRDDIALEQNSKVLVTFEPGDSTNTVSEALFEEWKNQPSLLDQELTQKEFLAKMYTAIAEIEKNPELNSQLMEQMGISSGDIDKVQLGQEIDLQPLYEYLNNRN